MSPPSLSTTSAWKLFERGPPSYIEVQIILCRGIPFAVNSNYFVIKKNRFPATAKAKKADRASPRENRKGEALEGKGMGYTGDFSSTFRWSAPYIPASLSAD